MIIRCSMNTARLHARLPLEKVKHAPLSGTAVMRRVVDHRLGVYHRNLIQYGKRISVSALLSCPIACRDWWQRTNILVRHGDFIARVRRQTTCGCVGVKKSSPFATSRGVTSYRHLQITLLEEHTHEINAKREGERHARAPLRVHPRLRPDPTLA